MDEGGLWKLFFATGLPEAYLALAALRTEQEEPLAQPAFGEERRQERI